MEACGSRGAPVCVGIDPVYECLPQGLQAGDPLQAIEAFCGSVLRAVEQHIPCVKVQIACFERYGGRGVEAFDRVVQEAKRMGLVVIADAKRGDIDVSSSHYAAWFLGPDGADALTVHSYLGADALRPFLTAAAREGKGLFALVRTTNPGSDAIQCLPLADGRTVSEAVADLLADLGASEPVYSGESGYSLLGAVVGATKASDAKALRARMPRQIFLVPGIGAQGGAVDPLRTFFNADGTGAILTASRSVIYAGRGPDWPDHVERAAIALKDQVASLLCR